MNKAVVPLTEETSPEAWIKWVLLHNGFEFPVSFSVYTFSSSGMPKINQIFSKKTKNTISHEKHVGFHQPTAATWATWIIETSSMKTHMILTNMNIRKQEDTRLYMSIILNMEKDLSNYIENYHESFWILFN